MSYTVTTLGIDGPLILEPRVFRDDRGYFFESFNTKAFARASGLNVEFVQDNQSFSEKGVLRGLHYQIQCTQGKLVRVSQGEVFDVAVDLRRRSPTFGQSVSVMLSAANRRQFWIPEGFAHGFVVLSDGADFLYKTTDYWFPEHERTLRWDDPALNIDWPIREPRLSAKDAAGVPLSSCDCFD